MTVKAIGCATLAAALGLLAATQAQAADAKAFQLTGTGDQIYACRSAGASFAWGLKGPEAVLKDDRGVVVGRHFAGPSWQAADGGVIVGEPLAASRSPEAGAVDWLVLRVKSKSGGGRFDSVAYITRTRTQGGIAPASGCDAAHSGAEMRVPYSATYTFFPIPPAP